MPGCGWEMWKIKKMHLQSVWCGHFRDQQSSSDFSYSLDSNVPMGMLPTLDTLLQCGVEVRKRISVHQEKSMCFICAYSLTVYIFLWESMKHSHLEGRKEKLGEFLIDTGKPRTKQDNDFQLQTQHPILGPPRSHNWRFPCARLNERMSYFIKHISMHTQSNCPQRTKDYELP